LDAGAFVDLVAEEANEHMTPLHFAVSAGHKEAFFLLLDHGADPHAVASYYAGAIVHYACQQADPGFLERLLREAVNVDQNGGNKGTPLQVACEKGNLQVVELLLQNRANVNLKDSFGKTPLNAALEQDHTDVAQRLLAAGADLMPDLPSKKQPLYVASMRGNETIVREIIAKAEQMHHDITEHIAASIAAVAYGKETISYIDTKRHPWTHKTLESQEWRRRDWHQGHIQVLRLLLEANPIACLANRSDFFSKLNPLTLAISRRNDLAIGGHSYLENMRNLKKIIQILIEDGALLDETDGLGETPLVLAAKAGRCEILNLLLDGGASVDYPDAEGQTALWWGVHNGDQYVVIELLKRGADPRRRNNAGQSAFGIAQKWEKYRHSHACQHQGFVETLKHIENYAAGREEPVVQAD
jgi:ankyrin repeat protein